MSAKYTHTIRPKNTVITKAIYDEDHQNHIDHGEAVYLDSISQNSSQLKSLLSPGDEGSEELGVSIEHDLQQLRYVIQQIRQTVQWYTSNKTRTVSLPTYVGNLPDTESYHTFPDGAGTTRKAIWVVPPSFVDADIVFTLVTRADTTGNAIFLRTAQIVEDNAIQPLDGATTNETTVGYSVAGNIVHTSWGISAQGVYTPGDVVVFMVNRNPAHAGDNLGASVYFYGFLLTYTAYSGRW